jgi:hypothetical protein
MNLGRSSRMRAWALLGIALLPSLVACGRRKPTQVNDITPSFAVNRERAPLGSAVEVTYTWTVGSAATKPAQDYRALVHFLDRDRTLLFTDDHALNPPATSWEPGKTYSYTRTVFIPFYRYAGEVQVVMGLYPVAGKGERMGLKGEDTGLREYKVGKMELLPQTENIFLVYKDGWHSPESSAQNPSLERTWTKKDALVAFKNPKKDILVYLEADTNAKAFDAPPVLTIAVGGKTGVVVPIADSEVFMKKVRVKAADLGNEEWVDLRLSMNQSFVPKAKVANSTDDRELGLMVYHLYVGDADALGKVDGVVDAGPVTLAGAAPAAAAKAPAAKPASPAAKTK